MLFEITVLDSVTRSEIGTADGPRPSVGGLCPYGGAIASIVSLDEMARTATVVVEF